MLMRPCLVIVLIVASFGSKVTAPRKPASAYGQHRDYLIPRHQQRRSRTQPRNIPPPPPPSPLESVGSNYSDYPSKLQRLAKSFIRFNRHEATQVKVDMTVGEVAQLLQMMYAVVQNDECANFSFGFRTGYYNCVSMYRLFKRVPIEYRGACANAYLAGCYKWRLSNGARKGCAFFIKTSPGESSPVQGQWQSIETCANGLFAVVAPYFQDTAPPPPTFD
nr:PREDICTED: uncharacterized protein LOC109031319 [Bemisia tabaci]